MHNEKTMNSVTRVNLSDHHFSGFIVWALLLLVLTACAHVPAAPKAESQAAKHFAPDVENGSIYVFRKSKFAGSAVDFPIQLDGQAIGKIGSGTFFNIKTPPGQHDIVAYAPDAEYVRVLTTLEVEKGKLYFVELTLGPRLVIVEEQVGRKGVLKGKLLEIQPPTEKGPKMFQ